MATAVERTGQGPTPQVTMSGVWDRTAEFLGDNLATVFAIAAPTILLPSAVQEILTPLEPGAGPGLKLTLGLVALIVSVIGLWGQAAIIALALEPALGRSGALGRAGRRLLPLIGISLLLLLALVLALAPVLGLLAAGGADLAQLAAGMSPTLSPGAGLLIALYVLVLLPIIAWLAARLATVSAVVIAERRGIGAIGRSWRSTRGLAARIVGVFVLFGIVALVAVLAAQTVFGSIFRLALGNGDAVNAATVLTALVVALVSTGLSVAICAFIGKLYLAVRDRDGVAVPQ